MPGRIKLKARSKYRNVRTLSHGIWFHSKREAARWGELFLLMKSGKITNLRRQWPYKLMCNGVDLGCYVADFVYSENGSDVIEDSKGYRTVLFILKKKLMKALYGIDVREV